MIGVRTLPEKPWRPLDMSDVRVLEEAGLEELARLAEKLVRQRERWPFWKRWLYR